MIAWRQPALARASLQRYLAEAAWFPTAYLPSQGTTWSPIDDSHARATVVAGGITAGLDFEFGADGLIRSASAPDRPFDDGRHPATPQPWRARYLAYAVRAGMLVAVRAQVAWELAGGDFAYWRGMPERVEYEPAAAGPPAP